MKRITPIYNTAGKVVIGFFFSAILLIGIAVMTYYTLNRLLVTMDELAQPSEKLTILQDLQSEIFLISQLSQENSKVDIRIKDSTISSLNGKLEQLERLSLDSLEQGYVNQIRDNFSVLFEGYISLYEVKKNLESRDFTGEALKKVELGILRRASIPEVGPVKRFSAQEFLLDKDSTKKKPKNSLQLVDPTIAERNLLKYLERLQIQNSKSSDESLENPQGLDSVLFGIRDVIKRIYREESFQRQKLANLESELSSKQVEIVGTIESLVETLQRRVINEANQKNRAASDLSYDVILFLSVLVILAIFGIIMVIYSVLKEIKLTRNYQENLLLSQKKAEDLARSKQEFLANMSHEIRNPLHVIQGYKTVLEKEPLDSSQHSHLRMIGFASDTLMEIVDEILDFSKLEAGKLKLEEEEFDPELLFGSIQNFFDLKAIEKQIQFNWELNLPEGKSLIGDQLRLKQILNNLLSNAFKFTDSGSVDVSINWEDNTLYLEVKDTGVGMNEEVLGKVFQEFNQADTSISRKYGGTGLGLAIVQRLIHLIGGEIKTESKVNEGTKMLVKLPMLVGDNLGHAKEASIGKLDLKGKRILLVDDDPVGIKYLATILKYFGATCTRYNGGIEFRESFEVSEFDIAIIDIHMPGFSGFEVIKKLRSEQQYIDLPILAMTANIFLDERDTMIKSGFDDILIKPFTEQNLIEIIGKYLPETVDLDFFELEERDSLFTDYQLSDLRKFCMGDESLLQEILQELIIQTRKELEELKKAWLNNRFEIILEVSHQMASRLGQIKSPASRIARKIETNLKMNNTNGLQPLLLDLDREVNSLLDALSNQLITEVDL